MDDEVARRDAVPAQRVGAAEPADPDGFAEPEPDDEWPPREWRETTRSAGHRQAGWVALAMVVMFGILVLVAIWGSHNG